MEEWIEEFLYRGRPPSGPDSDKEPTFHVVIGRQADSPLNPGEKVRRTVVMTPEQAEAAGWALASIVAEINAESIKQCDALKAKVTDLESQISDLKSQTVSE